jgi:hypothetical protein
MVCAHVLMRGQSARTLSRWSRGTRTDARERPYSIRVSSRCRCRSGLGEPPDANSVGSSLRSANPVRPDTYSPHVRPPVAKTGTTVTMIKMHPSIEYTREVARGRHRHSDWQAARAEPEWPAAEHSQASWKMETIAAGNLTGHWNSARASRTPGNLK